MGCCGSGGANSPSNAIRMKQSGPPSVTGYAVDMPDGRVLTYLTQEEAQNTVNGYNLPNPPRPVLGWK